MTPLDKLLEVAQGVLEDGRIAPQLQKKAREAIESVGVEKPIDMVLHCPRCHLIHVDAPEPEKGWTNPPHKSHLCHGCGLIWRPADVPTNGVASITIRGEKDWATFIDYMKSIGNDPDDFTDDQLKTRYLQWKEMI